MKITARICGIYKDEAPENLFSKLISICPEGNAGNYFDFRGSDNDDKLAKLIQTLDSYGWQAQLAGDPNRLNKYFFYMVRVYDETDYLKAIYFKLETQDIETCEGSRLPNGTLLLKSFGGTSGVPIILTPADDIAVNTTVKASIESAGLIGWKFNPMACDFGPHQEFTPYWELTSSKILPAMSTSSIFINDSAPMMLNQDKYFKLVEPPFSYPEYHYPIDTFNFIEPFDFALTNERFMLRDTGVLVVSQAVRQLFERLKIKIYWIPVRFDPPQLT